MTKTSGILTIVPLLCHHHHKTQQALLREEAILHLTLSLLVKTAMSKGHFHNKLHQGWKVNNNHANIILPKSSVK